MNKILNELFRGDMKTNPFRSLTSDIRASVVVLLVALPLCLGIALGSNAPLFSGIIAGIVGGIVVGILSGSSLSVTGPAAGLTVIVAGGIALLPTFESFLLAVVLAGIIQIILGVIKAGVIGDYVPNAVIKGMLAAIGIILILKQIPHLVGYDSDYLGDESFVQPDNNNTFTELGQMIYNVHPGAILVGVISMLILIVWETAYVKKNKVLSLLPGPLMAVIIGTIVHLILSSSGTSLAIRSEHLVSLPVSNGIDSFISFFTTPDFSQWVNTDVWVLAFTLAIVASLETLLGIEAVDKLDPHRRITPGNRELMAQGAGNIVSGLIGGLPVTSVIVRSSANVSAGAQTKLSSIFHGTLLLICVALIPGALNNIPLAALAAILIFVGYKLAKVSLFKEFWSKGRDQFIPFVATILAILFSDLLIGVLVGIVVSIVFMLHSNFHSSIMLVNDGNHYLMRFRKNVSFLNKPLIKAELKKIPDNTFLIIDADKSDFIDLDIIDTVNEFLVNAPDRNIRVQLKKSEHKSIHQFFGEPALSFEDDK